MTFAVGVLFGVAVGYVAMGLIHWWRRRQDQAPVSPRWLNENCYTKGGDDAQWK
jgi:hypothetical protein